MTRVAGHLHAGVCHRDVHGVALLRHRVVMVDQHTMAAGTDVPVAANRAGQLLPLVVADLAGWLPDPRLPARVVGDPLLPALRAGARSYLYRKSTEDAAAGIGGIVAGSG